MDTTTNEKPLTLKQAAVYTGYSEAYIYKLINQKKIPVYKPENGRILFAQADLNKFVYRNRQAADYELSEQADAILINGGRK